MEAHFLTIFAFIGCQLGFAKSDEASQEEYVSQIQHLRAKLFDSSRYDFRQRPLNNGSATTNVTVSIFHLSYANLEDDWLTLAPYICIDWQDDQLVWNKEDYGDVNYVIVSQNEAWFPDVTIINTNPNDYASERDTAYLHHTGSLWDCHPISVRVPCIMDLTRYPQDRHVCALRFSSTTYLTNEIRLIGFQLYNPEPTADWDVRYLEPSYGVALNRSYVDMIIEMRRRDCHYRYTVTLPWIASVILMLLVFWMPVDSDRRPWLACANLFLLVVMLGRIGTLLGRSAAVPKIVFFLGNVVVIQAAVALSAIFILNIASTPAKIPEWVVHFLSGPVGRLLGLNQVCLTANEPPAPEGSENAAFPRRRDEDGKKRDWFPLAQALDRLLFCVFAVVTLSVMPW